MNAAENLRANTHKLMEAHGISQADLAKRAGISHRSVTSILSGERSGHAPNLDTIESIAVALGTSVGHLLGASGPNVDAAATGAPAHLARQIARVVEDFLLSTPDGRKSILEYASTQADAAFRHSDK